MNESTLHGALRVTIERAPLAAALALLNRAVQRRNTIPILSNVCIEARGTGSGVLAFMSTNLDQQIVVDVPAYIGAPGRLTCDAAAFADIVRKLEAGAQVALTLERERLCVIAGRARYSLATLPRDDFPVIAEMTAPAPWSFNYDRVQLAHDLARLVPCISTEETKYYMRGISWRGDDTGALSLAATDGTIGAIIERGGFPDAYGLGLHDDPEYAGVGVTIMPLKMVDFLQRAIKAGAGDDVALTFDKTRCAASLQCSFGAVTITSKLIDGTFPDLRKFGFDVVAAGNPVAVATADRRVNPRMISKLSKSLGGKVAVALGDAGCIFTSPGAPEYWAVIGQYTPQDAGDDGAMPMRDGKGKIVEGAWSLPDLDEPLPYVEIAPLALYMGATLPDGWILPATVAVKKGKRDDAAAFAAYCAGKVAAAPVPIWTGARPRVWNADDLRYVPDGYGYIWRDVGAMIADYDDVEADSDDAAVHAVAAMSPAARVEAAREAVELAAPVAIEPHSAVLSVESSQAPETVAEAGIDAEALAWLEMAALPAVEPDATPFAVPDALKTSQFDAPPADASPDLAALVASLVARIEALESGGAVAEAVAQPNAKNEATPQPDATDWEAIARDRGAMLDSLSAENEAMREQLAAMTEARDRHREARNAADDANKALRRRRYRTAGKMRALRGRADLDKRALAATVEQVAQWRDDLDFTRTSLAAVTARAERAESELKRRAVLDPLAGLRYTGGKAALTR